MLVVVHHGDVESLFQSFFNIETFRCLDVFQVDAAEGGSYFLHGFAELLRVFFGHFNVEHINAPVYLEEQAFAFHDRLAAHGANVSQSEYGCAVADYGDEVALVCIFVYAVRIVLYFQTGISHTW